MLSKPNMPVANAADPTTEDRGEDTSAISPALIGMSLRQDIPGGLPSGRARFRFSCHVHSGTKDSGCQQKRSELRTVPTGHVSKFDTSHPSVPSFVPSVFPVCPNGFLAFPVFWIACHDPYGRSALVLRIFQQQGTLGTLGTGLTRHELRSAHSWNSHGTLGTDRRRADVCARVWGR